MSPLVHTYPTYPFEIARGEGVYVYDTKNNGYLDLYGGHAVCALGHSRPTITDAITRQAEKLFFYSNLTKLSVRDKAAESLLAFADSNLSSVFFCNSGAEANENALKFSVQLTGRQRLVAFQGGWHGRTTMATAATDDPRWHEKTPGWMGDVLFLEPNNEEELQKIDSTCAAAIIEPIQSIGGMREMKNSFLTALRKRTTETGTLLIFDEVQTGVGRLGVPYVNGHGIPGQDSHQNEVHADMSTSAKSLANGFPVGALLMTDAIASQVQLSDLGSTFGGGPLASVAISETLRMIQSEDLLTHIGEIGQYIRESLLPLPIVQEVRGQGCLVGLRLTHPAREVVPLLRDRWHILAGVSAEPDTMRLLPPYIVERRHIDELQHALKTIGEEIQ